MEPERNKIPKPTTDNRRKRNQVNNMDVKSQFETDVRGLLEELYLLNSYYLLHKHLNKLRQKPEYLKAMNQAPGFFGLTIASFQFSCIMGLAKIYENRGRDSKNIFKFLSFLEANHSKIFSNDEKTKKKLSRYTDITHETINEHKETLAGYETVIKNLIAWRDKGLAHNDKRFFKKELIDEAYPLTRKNIEDLIEVAGDILNTYQVAYNGNITMIEPSNTYDVDNVLQKLL